MQLSQFGCSITLIQFPQLLSSKIDLVDAFSLGLLVVSMQLAVETCLMLIRCCL